METIGYLFSIGIGIILGLLGGGGSILSIPLLVYFFQVDAVLASAYSLFIVGVTSLVGAVPKYRDHLVSVRAGLLFGLPSILSIFTTRKWIIPAVPEIIFQSNSIVLTKRLLILGLFAILMIVTSITMIAGQKEKVHEEREPNVGLGILEGVLIGFLTGMVGAGGGFLIIPALVMLTGLPFKTAVGTSLFVIAINALTGFLGDVINYEMNWPFLLLLTAFAIIGIFIGNRLTHKTSNSKLRRSFGWFVLLVGVWILFKELFAI
ncbi:MAG TPA: sulfite exporter TauE/SafE family protein [Chryseolinea sp.]